MPCTWVGWSYPGCSGTLGKASIPNSVKHSPIQIDRYGGYGTDGDGDGIADPWNVADAIFSASKMLAANGVQSDPRRAVLTYNQAGWYADEVLARAERFRTQAVYSPGDGAMANVVEAATSWLGKSNRYVFGGGRNSNDIARGHFDCSSFVHWAFKQAGIDLGPLHSTSTETLNKIGKRINFADIQPGDIIFFDSYKKDGHVGIWLGNGQWIGTQTSTGIAIVDQNDSYWSSIFKGHVRRIN